MKLRKKRVWTGADIKLNEQSTTLTAQLHGLSCPACRSLNYAKSGKEKGNQRYTCTKCGKKFCSTTGCTIHHLHLKPKIQEYLKCMDQGLSLRKTAVKCDISLQTAFRWRHRFLKAMQRQQAPRLHENRILSALVLPYSNKGKPEPVRTRRPITSILQIDAVGTATIQVLGKLGMPASKITSLSEGCTSHVASKSIPKLFKTGPAKCASSQQTQQAQEVTGQIQTWLAKFRGVASKYLANYWRWFEHINQMQRQICPPAVYMHNCF